MTSGKTPARLLIVTSLSGLIDLALLTRCHPNFLQRGLLAQAVIQIVEKEIEFLHANLCEIRVDSHYGYGFLDGTEERKEDLIEQFTTLNSTCFVRSTTEVKERSQRSFENSILNLYFFFCAFYVCNFRENENDCAKQRTNTVKAGYARVFMFILQNNLTFRCLFFC